MLTKDDLKFFNTYPGFDVNPKARSSRKELKRLANVKGWPIGGSEYCQAKWKFDARNSTQKSGETATSKLDVASNQKKQAKKQAKQPSMPKKTKEPGGALQKPSTLADDLAKLSIDHTLLQRDQKTNQSTPKRKKKNKKDKKEANTKASSALPANLEENLARLNLGVQPTAFFDSDSESGVGIFTPPSSDFDEDEVRYFDRFPNFEPDESASLQAEFDRLAHLQGWERGSKSYNRQLIRCYEKEFRHFCGSNISKIGAWQSICKDLGVDPLPVSINQCRKALAGKFVNIFDFIDCKRGGRKIEPVFASVARLRKYTTTYEMIFPKATAKKNPMLRVLLNKLFGYS